MADKAASVLAKLRNKAKASGISYQQCLQLFVQEEFLRKLSKSGYGDTLILKGGLFIYTLTNFESRATIDVDFLLRGYPNSIEDIKDLIGKIIDTPTGNDYIEMRAKGFEEISPQRKYHGISTQIIAQIKNVRVPFNIDIQNTFVHKSELQLTTYESQAMGKFFNHLADKNIPSKINKEIRNYTESMFFGLSLRQFIFSVLACGVAVGLYFLLRPHFGTETLSWVCILGAAPFALMGFVKYNGMNAEQFVWAWIKSEFLMPKKLVFHPDNLYYETLKATIQNHEKEALKNNA